MAGSRHAKARAQEEPRRKRRWVRGTFLTLLVIGLLGLGAFAAAVFLTPVPDPNEVARTEATVVYYSDGTTEIGRLGEALLPRIPVLVLPLEELFKSLGAGSRYHVDGILGADVRTVTAAVDVRPSAEKQWHSGAAWPDVYDRCLLPPATRRRSPPL